MLSAEQIASWGRGGQTELLDGLKEFLLWCKKQIAAFLQQLPSAYQLRLDLALSSLSIWVISVARPSTF